MLNPAQSATLSGVYAFNQDQTITRNQLLVDALTLSSQLPDYIHVINLCENRYHFTVALLAALFKQQLTLLPANQQPTTLEEVIHNYTDCYYLYDNVEPHISVTGHHVTISESDQAINHHDFPHIPGNQEVCIVFTSGSSGKPQANIKTWETLAIATDLAMTRFGLTDVQAKHIVCTVHPQHMYGLETSVFYPLLGNTAVHSGKPFFPEDIRSALEEAPGLRILITTPIHLKACVNSNIDWPAIDLIISATAPLTPELAQQAEACMQTEVKEIFGCTEAGSIASRHTSRSEIWKLFDNMTFTTTSDGRNMITGPQLQQSVEIQDSISILDSSSFKLLGRHSDMLNIAGKRASLSDLNQKLNSINGVQDAVYLLQQDNGTTARLSAMVVAPGLDENKILQELKRLLDPVFLPRPLFMVESLPRNAIGKLPKEDLRRYFEQVCLA